VHCALDLDEPRAPDRGRDRERALAGEQRALRAAHEQRRRADAGEVRPLARAEREPARVELEGEAPVGKLADRVGRDVAAQPLVRAGGGGRKRKRAIASSRVR